MKRFIWIIILILIGNIIKAQPDSIFDSFDNDFKEFSKSVEDEFNTSVKQSDSAFLKFLEEAWKEYNLFLQIQPVRPKPKEQPIIKENPDTTRCEIEIAPFNHDTITSEEQINDTVLHELKPVNYQSRIIIRSFDIFGIHAQIHYYPDKLPDLSSVNEQSIIAFYRKLSDNNLIWNDNINELGKIKKSYHFNDWGYYNIIKKAAENVFDNKNEQVLFIWYVLVQSGYRVKVGYDDSFIYLLIPSKQELYNIQFLSEKGLKYYLFQGERNQVSQIKTYKGFYMEGAKIFSFRIDKLPELNNETLEYRQFIYKNQNIKLEFNKSIIEFLNSYPQCTLDVYFNVPVSSTNSDVLDRIFVPVFKAKTNREKVDILLSFIQGSVAYKTDQEQFGKERYMFAEECLYYPYSDCEDRAVLLGQMVKHFTGLPVIGLEFKNHVTLAVHFPNEKYGSYVLVDGKKYFICDSTYINAKSGMIPEDLKNEKPKIISDL